MEQSWDDLSYFSLLLNLPSELTWQNKCRFVDVEAIHTAREFVLLTLAEQLQSQLKPCTWKTIGKNQDYLTPALLAADASKILVWLIRQTGASG